MEEETTTAGSDPIECCARAAHEANRAYCMALGDYSQPAWDDAPQWQRESARKGVYGVLEGNGPAQSHESWLAEKFANGWKHGPVKNPEAREHPCMVPYEELAPEQRAKDAIFVAVVRSTAGALGLPVNLDLSVEAIGQFFHFNHLPNHLADVSRPFGMLAHHVMGTLPRNAERSAALRKLLEAKDAAVRARIAR